MVVSGQALKSGSGGPFEPNPRYPVSSEDSGAGLSPPGAAPRNTGPEALHSVWKSLDATIRNPAMTQL